MEDRSFKSSFGVKRPARELFSSNSNLAHGHSSTYNIDDELTVSPKRRKNSNSGSYTGMFNRSGDEAAIPSSPWEWRKMKSELISLKTRLGHQEATVQQLHRVRREMEDVFQNEKRALEIQIQQDQDMIRQMELRVNTSRKAIMEAKAAQVRAETDLSQLRGKMEQKIIALIDEKNKLSEELRRSKDSEKQIEPKTPILTNDETVAEIQDKLNSANGLAKDLQEKLRESRAVEQKYELQSIEVQNLKIRLQSLEHEKSTWEEGKKLISQVSRTNELEKELQHSKEIILSLRDSVKGKLLLEEQIADMEHKIQQSDLLEKQIIQLELKQADLISKLMEYEAIGINGGPEGIRQELHRLQQAQTLSVAEEGQLRSKADSLQRELLNLQLKYDEIAKVDGDKFVNMDRMSKLISRLQKKMILVTRERDSYKEQNELLEKEMSDENRQPNVQIADLEKVIDGYKELCARLEKEVETIDQSSKANEKKLRQELDKLKGELEHRALKGDFNVNCRVMHYKMNPLAVAEEQAQEKQKAMVRELEELRRLVSTGSTAGSTQTSSLHAQELSELQQNYEIKMTRLKEAFKSSSHEFRQALLLLFGWRVDRTKEGQYKLSSQYADSPDDYLFFVINDDVVNMVETPFSATIPNLIEIHLTRQQSVPMFINAVQSELFEQQTAQIMA